MCMHTKLCVYVYTDTADTVDTVDTTNKLIKRIKFLSHIQKCSRDNLSSTRFIGNNSKPTAWYCQQSLILLGLP